MANGSGTHNGPPSDASVGALVKQLSEQASRLAGLSGSRPWAACAAGGEQTADSGRLRGFSGGA